MRAGDIDIVYVYGYGFPAWRGGPMWHADAVGLGKIRSRLRQLEATHGELWEPAPLLKRLAEEGGTFAEFDRGVSAAVR